MSHTSRKKRNKVRPAQSLDKRKSTAPHQFTAEQNAMLESLLRKHTTIMLVEVDKHIWLLEEHWRYIKPEVEARRLCLFPGVLTGAPSNYTGIPYLYLYDRDRFRPKKPR